MNTAEQDYKDRKHELETEERRIGDKPEVGSRTKPVNNKIENTNKRSRRKEKEAHSTSQQHITTAAEGKKKRRKKEKKERKKRHTALHNRSRWKEKEAKEGKEGKKKRHSTLQPHITAAEGKKEGKGGKKKRHTAHYNRTHSTSEPLDILPKLFLCTSPLSFSRSPVIICRNPCPLEFKL